jgi:outer membrane protein assembly factor BamA
VIGLLIAGAMIMPQAQAQTQAAASGPEKVAEIRVHGNARMSDDMVIQLAGISLGETIDAAGLAAIEKRLKDSGRFDEVQVRKRYRTLEMDDVALLLVVHEKPGVTENGQPPTTFRKLRSHLMFFPIVYYDDGYGWTYGMRTSLVNIAGKGTHFGVPLSWGADKHAAFEADRTFNKGPLTRAIGSFGILQRENPFYLQDDQRVYLKGRAERRLFDKVTLGGVLARTQVEFGTTDQIWTTTADATLDTRRDPMYPVDAVLTGVVWTRFHAIGVTTFSANGDSVDKVTYDARGYKRLFKQNVFAARVRYDTSSGVLPPYEQPLLEGANVRSAESGELVGDKRLLWSAELRMPISSPLSTGRLGFSAFYDAGAVAPYGQSVSHQTFQRGAGAGAWLIFTVIQLNLDVAHSFNGQGTRVHFGTGFSF